MADKENFDLVDTLKSAGMLEQAGKGSYIGVMEILTCAIGRRVEELSTDIRIPRWALLKEFSNVSNCEENVEC